MGLVHLQDPRATAEKVPRIIVGVEADQVAMEHTLEDFVSHRKNTINLTTGKWRVEEEAELNVLLGRANFLPQHGWKKHEVVVMDPDKVIILDVLCDGLCKKAIGFAVGLPRRLVKCNLTGMVVEEGPKNRVCNMLGLVSLEGLDCVTHWRSRCNVCRPARRP